MCNLFQYLQCVDLCVCVILLRRIHDYGYAVR